MRFLLVRGADHTIANNKGQTCLDLVQELKNPNLQRDLTKMLGNPGICDCLMLSTQTRFIARSRKTMIVYLMMFFYVVLVEIFYVFPSKCLLVYFVS